MPKYWVKNYFVHGRFPKVGQKQKTERKKKKKRKEERMNDGNNNGQATHGARKPPGPMLSQNMNACIVTIQMLSQNMIACTVTIYKCSHLKHKSIKQN